MAEMNFDNTATEPAKAEAKEVKTEKGTLNIPEDERQQLEQQLFGAQAQIVPEPNVVPAPANETDTTPDAPSFDFNPAPSEPTNEAGMTMEEINDPNKIKVTIADDETPLVILFGPPSSGKTMVLIRLTRYLKGKDGYKVEPIRSFRPTYDKNYRDICDNFDELVDNDDAASSTSKINFMLVRVSYKGKPLCQILEAPGEHYFKPKEPNKPYPRYINRIMSSDNRKIWAIMVEPEHTNAEMDVPARKSYANKVKDLKSDIGSRDKVLFIFNKIDESNFVIKKDKAIINYEQARKYISKHYPNIYTSYVNVNPLTKWFLPYNFGFVAFQTGSFPIADDGTKKFEQGHNVYPKKLWETVCKFI